MEILPFEDALVSFGRFLRKEGQPEHVHWIFRDDLIRMPALAIRVPLPATNRDVARDVYERARTRGLGVAMGAVCRLGDGVAAFVLAPQDEQEAELLRLPPDQLKMSIGVRFPVAVEIRSRLEWRIRALLSPRWDLVPARPRVEIARAVLVR
jgi:hypothetical protein